MASGRSQSGRKCVSVEAALRAEQGPEWESQRAIERQRETVRARESQ